jgi:hypothetical protein
MNREEFKASVAHEGAAGRAVSPTSGAVVGCKTRLDSRSRIGGRARDPRRHGCSRLPAPQGRTSVERGLLVPRAGRGFYRTTLDEEWWQALIEGLLSSADEA